MSITLQDLIKKYPLPDKPVSVEEYLRSFNTSSPFPAPPSLMIRPTSSNMTPRPSSSNMTPIPFSAYSAPSPRNSFAPPANQSQQAIPAIELKIMTPNGPYTPQCDWARRVSAEKIIDLTNSRLDSTHERDWLNGLTQARFTELRNNMGYY